MSTATTKPDQNDATHTFNHVECSSLTVKHPNSKASVQIIANEQATGIWVSSGNGNEWVHLVSISVDPKDGPMLQLLLPITERGYEADNHRLHMLPLAKLIELVEPADVAKKNPPALTDMKL